MLWILQKNLFNEKRYITLVETLERMNIPRLLVKPLPFTSRLIPDDWDLTLQTPLEDIPEPLVPEGPKWVMGTYTLARIAQERGWWPGSFLENLNYLDWQWSDNYLLNPNAYVTTPKKAQLPEGDFFCRPLADSKVFSGGIFNRAGFIEWRDSLPVDGEACPSTQILIAPVKEIYTETRFWIVNGRIVTGSEYKRGGYTYYTSSVDPGAYNFTEQAIYQWTPNQAFVIDIAYTSEGYKIIEVNNMNSAGLYEANVGKLIEAIEGLV